MNRFGLLGLAALCAACTTQTGNTPNEGEGKADGFENPECAGAYRDGAYMCRTPDHRFANAECCRIRCRVIWVDDDLNGDLLEEGFGSPYSIDPHEGYGDTDEDSTDVTIEFGSEPEIRLGQHGFGADEAELSMTSDAEEEDYSGNPYRSYVVSEDDEGYEVRIFEESNLGTVLYSGTTSDYAPDESGEWRHVDTQHDRAHYATIDCNLPHLYAE